MMSINDIKVGVVNYFATGEGATIFLFCNIQNQEPKHVDGWDYYSKGLEYVTISELINNETNNARIINELAPFLKNVLSRGQFGNIDYFQKFHVNYS
jgi:hypothetical protein